MDTDGPPAQPPVTQDEQRIRQVDNAIRAIQQKKPVPEIDFTIHTMEDGTQVSTLERVCKGEPITPCIWTPRSALHLGHSAFLFSILYSAFHSQSYILRS